LHVAATLIARLLNLQNSPGQPAVIYGMPLETLVEEETMLVILT
jgi:hypothetical protein